MPTPSSVRRGLTAALVGLPAVGLVIAALIIQTGRA